MQDWYGNNQIVVYTHFKLLDPTFFNLSIGGFRGNVKDSMAFSNNMRFATYDSPDLHNCATHQHAGWWYNYCAYALLNGKYYHGPYAPTGGFYDGSVLGGMVGVRVLTEICKHGTIPILMFSKLYIKHIE